MLHVEKYILQDGNALACNSSTKAFDQMNPAVVLGQACLCEHHERCL